MENFKSLALSSKEGSKSKFLLIEDGTIQFEPRENANIFKKFYSELATDLVKKLPIAPNTFCGSTTKDYYVDVYNNKKNEFRLLNVTEDVIENILSCLNTNNESHF